MNFLRYSFLVTATVAILSCEFSEEQSIEALLQRATESHSNGKFRASIIDLKNILVKQPESRKARILLSKVYLDIGDAASAEKELNSAKKLGGDTKITNFLLARIMLLSGRNSEVLNTYKITPNLSSELKSKYNLFQGLAYLSRGNLELAERKFQAARAEYKNDIEISRPHLILTEKPDLVEALIGLTNVAIDRKEYDVAKNHLDNARELAPEDSMVLAATGDLSFKLKNYQQSVNAYTRAFKNSSHILNYQLGMARAQLALQETENALKNLTNILKLYPDNLTANLYTGLSYLKNSNFDKAKEIGDKLLSLNPNYPKAHMISGLANYGLGNFEQATIMLERYLSHSPYDKKVRRIFGLSQLQLRDHNSALKTFSDLSKAEPTDVGLLSLIAEASIKQGNMLLAEKSLREAIELKPNFEEARLQLATLQLRQGQGNEAIEELERTINKSPELLRSKYGLMHILLRAGEFEKALDLARDLKTRDPQNTDAHIGAGLAHFGMKDWDTALSYFNDVLHINPDHLGALFAIADVYIQTGKFDELRQVYGKILKTRPTHLLTKMRLIGLYQREGKDTEALRLIKETIKENPEALAPRLLAAQNLVERGHPLKAVSMLEQVSDKGKENSNWLLMMGRAKIAANKPGEALGPLRELVHISPGTSAGYYLLGEVFGQLNNASRMLEYLDKAVQIDPDFTPASVARVRALVLMNRHSEAEVDLQALKGKHPRSSDISRLEAWVNMNVGRPEEAEKILNEVSRKDNSEIVAIDLASAQWMAGKRRLAIKSLHSWIQSNLNTSKAKFHLANLLLLEDQKDEALEVYIQLAEQLPNNIIVLNNLANLLIVRDPAKAYTYAKRAYEISPNSPPTIILLASLKLANKEDPLSIVKLLRPITDAYPQHAEAHIILAKALDKMGRTQNAIDLLADFEGRAKEGVQVDRIQELITELEKK